MSAHDRLEDVDLQIWLFSRILLSNLDTYINRWAQSFILYIDLSLEDLLKMQDARPNLFLNNIQNFSLDYYQVANSIVS